MTPAKPRYFLVYHFSTTATEVMVVNGTLELPQLNIQFVYFSIYLVSWGRTSATSMFALKPQVLKIFGLGLEIIMAFCGFGVTSCFPMYLTNSLWQEACLEDSILGRYWGCCLSGSWSGGDCHQLSVFSNLVRVQHWSSF